MGHRPRVEPTDDWEQLQLLAPFPEQRADELLRPVVLYGRSPAQRAGETGTPERTLSRRAARFDAEGMASLFPPPKVEQHRRLPAKVRAAIRDLKAEHPVFRASEIADICAVRFAHRPSPHTVKRILAEDPPLARTGRRFPPYRDIADAATARLAILRLHSEGWAVKSIAAYLACSRQQVYRTLRRWIAEGVAGLDDKSRARAEVPRKVTFRAIATVKELQENPRLGEFRIHAALRQQGIVLSPRTCGRILAKNRTARSTASRARKPRRASRSRSPSGRPGRTSTGSSTSATSITAWGRSRSTPSPCWTGTRGPSSPASSRAARISPRCCWCCSPPSGSMARRRPWSPTVAGSSSPVLLGRAVTW
jgi:transposase